MLKDLMWFDDLNDKDKLYVLNDMLYMLLCYVYKRIDNIEEVFEKVMEEDGWKEGVKLEELNGLILFYERLNSWKYIKRKYRGEEVDNKFFKEKYDWDYILEDWEEEELEEIKEMRKIFLDNIIKGVDDDKKEEEKKRLMEKYKILFE